MNEKTKKVELEILAEETVHHLRTVCIEVPEEMTDEEIESLDVSIFNEGFETGEWQIEESDGIWPCGKPTIVGPAGPGAEIELTLESDDLTRIRNTMAI